MWCRPRGGRGGRGARAGSKGYQPTRGSITCHWVQMALANSCKKCMQCQSQIGYPLQGARARTWGGPHSTGWSTMSASAQQCEWRRPVTRGSQAGNSTVRRSSFWHATVPCARSHVRRCSSERQPPTMRGAGGGLLQGKR